MKAITVRQPWASLIAEGIKTIETRPKRSPWSSAIGETIAIHAAKRTPETMVFGDSWWCERTWDDEFGLLDDGGNPRRLPLGAVVATCTLRDVVPMVATRGYERSLIVGEHLTIVEDAYPGPDGEAEQNGWTADAQRPFGDFTPGRWALLLDNIVKTVPAPCRGYQGLWTLPSEVSENLLGLAAQPAR